jgi:hypothetical protein
MLFSPAMYLREALSKCQDLERRAARLYATRAAFLDDASESGQYWSQQAATESAHAEILSNLLRTQEINDDDGPFVIDLRQQITRLCEALDEAYAIEEAKDQQSRSACYSPEFLLHSCDTLFARIVRLAELSRDDP